MFCVWLFFSMTYLCQITAFLCCIRICIDHCMTMYLRRDKHKNVTKIVHSQFSFLLIFICTRVKHDSKHTKLSHNMQLNACVKMHYYIYRVGCIGLFKKFKYVKKKYTVDFWVSVFDLCTSDTWVKSHTILQTDYWDPQTT